MKLINSNGISLAFDTFCVANSQINVYNSVGSCSNNYNSILPGLKLNNQDIVDMEISIVKGFTLNYNSSLLQQTEWWAEILAIYGR